MKVCLIFIFTFVLIMNCDADHSRKNIEVEKGEATRKRITLKETERREILFKKQRIIVAMAIEEKKSLAYVKKYIDNEFRTDDFVNRESMTMGSYTLEDEHYNYSELDKRIDFSELPQIILNGRYEYKPDILEGLITVYGETKKKYVFDDKSINLLLGIDFDFDSKDDVWKMRSIILVLD